MKIAWLYDDILNLYGDQGNILVIKRLLEDNQIDYKIDKISLFNKQKLDDYDILFLGGGSDLAQTMIYEDLLDRKPEIQKLIDKGGFIIAICGGYQLFGKEYIKMDGKSLKGLGFFDYITRAGDKRLNGNIWLKSKLGGQEIDIIGYENHQGYTTGVVNPLGQVIRGGGNENAGEEGFINEFFLGSYVHGPLLPKNPEIAKYVLETVLLRKYNIKQEIKISYPFAMEAKEQIKNALKE